MTVAEILGRALRWQAVLTVVVVAAGSVLAWFVAGVPGVLGVVLGGLLAVVFMGMTGVSILIANRMTKGEPGDVLLFFAIVLGGWLAKFVVFLVVGFLLRGAEWLSSPAFGITAIVVVVGSLVIDAIAVARSRMPPIDVQLPVFGADPTDSRADSDSIEPVETGEAVDASKDSAPERSLSGGAAPIS